VLTRDGSSAERLHRAIKYRPDIDGLRAIAITSVVAYHAGLRWTKGGFVGVDVFFVISGYLIGSLVYKEIRERSFSIAKFYERRAKRILPALFGVLLFSYMAAVLLLSPMELKMFSGSARATVMSSSNIFFFLRTWGYFATDTDLSPLLMTWSLGVEEQFYILFPLLMLLLRKASWKAQFWSTGALAAVSLAAALAGTRYWPGFTFFMLPTRAWELAGGVLLAIFEANRAHAKSAMPRVTAHGMSVVGLGLIFVALGVLNSKTPFPGWAALLPVAGAVLVIAARDGIGNRVLALRPFVFVGLISYSWYLWHWPLLCFARVTSDDGISVPVGVGIGAVSFACAVMSYRFVERPFRTSATPTARLLWRYGVLALVVMAPAVFYHVTNGLPQRNREVQRLETASQELTLDTCMVQEPMVQLPLRARCVPAGEERALALIGDSHAAELGEALRGIGTRNGYKVVELTKGWCPPLGGGVTRSRDGIPAFAGHCAEFNRERLAYISADPHIKVVVAGAEWANALSAENPIDKYLRTGDETSKVTMEESREALASGLEAMVEQMRAAGKTVYIVQDAAGFGFDPVRLLKTRMMWARRTVASVVAEATLSYPGDIAPMPDSPDEGVARNVIDGLAARNPDVHLIDLQGALCDVSGCRFAEGNETLYEDRWHLTSRGARLALAKVRLPK